ncbi:mechanosensitive ion channel family protein [soil metagenome]
MHRFSELLAGLGTRSATVGYAFTESGRRRDLLERALNFDPTINKLREMLDGFLSSLPNLVAAVLVAVGVFVLSKGLRESIRQVLRRSGASEYAGLIIGRIAQWFVLAFGVLVSVSILFPSINAETLVGILGLGSLAIGFAFRDIAQNFLAGVLILLTQPFKIGDQIDINGFEGTVQDIQTRATFIRTYDGRVVVVPNADFLTDTVVVNTAYEIRRSEYDVGIGYPDDMLLAKRLIIAAVRDLEGVLKEPGPDVLTVDLSDSSVNLRVRWWTDSNRSDVVATSDRVITAVKLALDEGGVNIPFPIRTVYLNQVTSEQASN